ncbi:hypothetical protein SAMN04488009_0248, partial [Maribacter sedimenticola]
MFPKKRLLLLVLIFISIGVHAQVKIGQNPNQIHSASIVELESTNKAFVLTRLSTAQMQAITPLSGAVVYNTDTQCVYYYNGLNWNNLCSGVTSSSFSFTDNGDGTILLSDGNGNDITFDGTSQTITSLVDNGDGTYTYTNEAGDETVISIAHSDNQNLETNNSPGYIGIENGNSIIVNVDDADADDQNEIQSLSYSSGLISLTNDPNETSIDISRFDMDASDDFDGSFINLTNIPTNLDTDATDDYNTGITFDGTELTITDLGGDQSVDISGLAYDDAAIRADVDRNTSDIATNVSDITDLQSEQTVQDTNIGDNTSNITANADAIAAHNLADGDLSDSNEFNTAINFDGTELTITDLGGDQSVDISGLAYDDTAIRANVDRNTSDIATNVSDITDLQSEQTVQDTNIGDNTSNITANADA